MSKSAWSTTVSSDAHRVISNLPQHTYYQLPENTIRLLRVRQSLARWYEVPVCTIETHFLGTCPAYVALSYTWGPPEDYIGDSVDGKNLAKAQDEYGVGVLYPVVVNGQLLGVRGNLFKFLRSVGSRLVEDKKPESDLYWIDALCINQSDLDERNHQVGMMGSIYQQADRVLVWLGEGDPHDTSVVEDMIKQVFILGTALDLEASNADMPSQVIWERRINQQQFLAGAGLPSFNDQRWQTLCTFLQRNWFSRVWVLQEAGLAKHVDVLCGSTTFSLERLGRCGDILRYGLDHSLGRCWSQQRDGAFRPLGQTMHRLSQIRQWCKSGADPFNEQWNWWLLLVWNGSLDASRPAAIWNILLRVSNSADASEVVDHVYALSGLLKHLAPQVNVPLHIDYSMSELDVRLETWKYILKETNWLNAICLVEHTRGHIQLPSWIPHIDKSKYHKTYSHFLFDASRSLHTSGMVPGLPEFIISNKSQLLVCGKKVARISEIGGDDVRRLHKIYEGILSLLATFDHEYEATGEKCFTAIWKTRIAWAGRNQPGQDADRLEQSFRTSLLAAFADIAVVTIIELSDHYSEDDLLDVLRNTLVAEVPKLYGMAQTVSPGKFPSLEKMIEEVLQWKILGQSRASNGIMPDSLLVRMLRGEETYTSITNLSHYGHRMFKTDTGLMGLGSEATEVGDEVWLLPRTTVPIVLRKVDDVQTKLQNKNGECATGDDSAQQGPERPCYLVIGESYVHGAMYGELVDKWDALAEEEKQSWSWEDITLI